MVCQIQFGREDLLPYKRHKAIKRNKKWQLRPKEVTKKDVIYDLMTDLGKSQ